MEAENRNYVEMPACNVEDMIAMARSDILVGHVSEIVFKALLFSIS
jgi:hypothetical protein